MQTVGFRVRWDLRTEHRPMRAGKSANGGKVFVLFRVYENYICAEKVYNFQYMFVGLPRITPKCPTCVQNIHPKTR